MGNDLPDPSIPIDSHKQAWQQLINRTIPQDELPSLIEAVFSDRKVINMVDLLQESHAQAFIDVIDGALGSLDLAPHVRRNCVKSLYRMCARYSLLPGSLQIEVWYNPTTVPHSRGGFADVWKGKCRDREVAVKVLRTDSKSNIRKIVRGFCKEFVTWGALNHPNVLPLLGVMVTEDRFAMVSEWMMNGNINQFVMAHRDVNRFELLSDVARGLIYMHGQGMIHGDLKGLNILVDQTCRARLADFGLLTIISDSTTLNSSTHGGTTRWMSPELLDPEVQDHRRTVFSDYYALGMVIYEVLSERTPFYQFYQCSNVVISWKILKGIRPERPEGAEGGWFTDDVWKVLGRCWVPQPGDRPNVEDILLCLEKVSRSWTPALVPPMAGSLTQESSDTTVLRSTDERGVLPPSEVAPHQPPVKLGQKEVAGIVNETPPNDLGKHPPLRVSHSPPARGVLIETSMPENNPLFKSRHPTRTKWINNTNPKRYCHPLHIRAVVTCLIFSHERIILASEGPSVHVYSPYTGRLTISLDGHEGGVWALSATKDVVVSGSTDRTVRIWDLNTGRCTHVFGDHTDMVFCLAIVKPEWIDITGGDDVIRREKWPKRPMIVSGSRDRTLHVWLLPRPGDIEQGHLGSGEDGVGPIKEGVNENPYHKFLLRGHGDTVRDLAARGRTLVSGSYDAHVRVWDIITGECKWVFTGHAERVYSVVLDPTRNIVCSSSEDRTVRVWDLNTGAQRFMLTGHTSRVDLLELSASHLVSASADSTLRVWDPDTGEMKHTLAAHTGPITCFQHGESKVLTGSKGTIKMWDLNNGSVVRDLFTGMADVQRVTFDGRWCAAASRHEDRAFMHIWDFGTG